MKRLRVILIFTAFTSALALAPSAQADLQFCPTGAGAGQCQGPRGLATDFETDRLYVADEGNNRVNVFKASTAEFLFAFGWGVADGTTLALQKCSTTCFRGIAGSGAGQLGEPAWIAVDNSPSASQHDLYVTDRENHRVQKFDPEGHFQLAFGKGVNTGTSGNPDVCTNAGPPTDVCGAGSEGTEAGQFASIRGIAVIGTGVIYVNDTKDEGLCPEETDTPKVLKRVQKFEEGGTQIEEVKPTDAPCGPIAGFTADGSGNYYLATEGFGRALSKYPPLGTTASCMEAEMGEYRGIGVDAADNLFVFQGETAAVPGGVGHDVVTELGSACNPVRRFGYGKIGGFWAGVAAFHGAAGNVFGTEAAQLVRYLSIPPPGSLVARTELLFVGSARAKVRAEINPEGKASTYHFEYITQEGFEEQGNSFTGPNTRSTEPKALSTAKGLFRANVTEEAVLGCPVATKALIEEGKCLTPETAYRWRVVVGNADGEGEGPKEGAPFTTNGPIEIREVFATAVDTATATLNGRVDPLGIPATGFFEYVDEASFQASGFDEATRVPTSGEIDFGASEGAAKRSVTLYPLKEGTTYHFRLAAINPLIDGHRFSEEATFTTFRGEGAVAPCPANEAFRAGPSGLLPDCRAYELVSPLDKANGDITALAQLLTLLPAVVQQSATSGDKLTYGSYRAFGDARSAPYTSQYIAERNPAAGWRTHPISPPQEELIKGAAEFDFEFQHFSPDLCEGWIVPLAEPVLAPGGTPGYYNLYRRGDELCGGESYEAISTAPPENFLQGDALYRPELQGVSEAGDVAVFVANDSLEGSGAPAQSAACPPGCRLELYAKGPGAGPPRFVCVLPGGAPATTACSAGSGASVGFPYMRSASVTNALSADGTRIYWSASQDDGRLYLRENPLGKGAECSGPQTPCTIDVSKAAETLQGTSSSHFWAAARDGSVAVFSTGTLGGPKAGLYEFDAEAKATQKIAGEVFGVLGASEDARRVYLVSGEVLSGEELNSEGDKAQAGEPNLYLYEAGAGGGSFRFVATLAAADARAIFRFSESSAVGLEPRFHNSRVTGSGLAAAFMASAPITGYDNSDASSPARCGQAGGICDNEVFLYDATAGGGAGEVICASCNPTGARPEGINLHSETFPFWAAGRLPVFQTTLYPGRFLSEGGTRLFFESQDALVPRDSNGHLDVYQWERAETGGCTRKGATFSAAAGGCIDLISSGQSNKDSLLVDADPSGENVFFTTLSGLVAEDYGLIDVYDARVGGGIPSPPPPDPECEGETCQSPAAAPEFGAPATSTYEGPGNLGKVAKPRHRGCGKSRRRVVKGGKSRCVRKTKKHKRARERGRAVR